MDKSTRRQFIGNTGKAAIAGTAIFAPSLKSNDQEMKNVFIHHVFFWLNNPDSKADKDKLVEGLKNLSKVKTIQQFHIGQPADTDRDVIERTYAISWLLNFADAADQESYQTDPVHLKFIEDYKHLWKKVIVYDSVDLK